MMSRERKWLVERILWKKTTKSVTLPSVVRPDGRGAKMVDAGETMSGFFSEKLFQPRDKYICFSRGEQNRFFDDPSYHLFFVSNS